ncbi:MAG TPA: hypothetical protein PKL35_07365, partial [Methanoregulaceae archaeon]|nr:hypothetical protein [Methanoregulaceae archaeon]
MDLMRGISCANIPFFNSVPVKDPGTGQESPGLTGKIPIQHFFSVLLILVQNLPEDWQILKLPVKFLITGNNK